MAVQYAKDRIQFGRPIGSFQAIKHKCADLHVALESARSAARAAAVAAATMSDDLPELAAIAGSFCGEACLLAGHENIQIHGGMGFTWEHPAHLYYKRAKSSEFLFGDVQYHREILADIIGLERSTGVTIGDIGREPRSRRGAAGGAASGWPPTGSLALTRGRSWRRWWTPVGRSPIGPRTSTAEGCQRRRRRR